MRPAGKSRVEHFHFWLHQIENVPILYSAALLRTFWLPDRMVILKDFSCNGNKIVRFFNVFHASGYSAL